MCELCFIQLIISWSFSDKILNNLTSMLSLSVPFIPSSFLWNAEHIRWRTFLGSLPTYGKYSSINEKIWVLCLYSPEGGEFRAHCGVLPGGRASPLHKYILLLAFALQKRWLCINFQLPVSFQSLRVRWRARRARALYHFQRAFVYKADDWITRWLWSMHGEVSSPFSVNMYTFAAAVWIYIYELAQGNFQAKWIAALIRLRIKLDLVLQRIKCSGAGLPSTLCKYLSAFKC
jgi:hypothetical protein